VSDIFQEVDEELRRENFAKLWARFGKYVIALAVLVLLATGGISQWRKYQLHLRELEGARYIAALNLANEGKDKDAADAFAAIAREAGGGHATLARFEVAAMQARSGNLEGAIAAYAALAADGTVDSVYRDLATLLWAQLSLKDGDPKAIIVKLAPYTQAESPWHPTALELTALADLKAGDKPRARVLFQEIADDLLAPQGARARASEMLTALAE
jgi:hypothetical protein